MAYFKLWRRKLKTALKLSWSERFLLLQALVLFPVIAMLLKLKGMKAAQKVISFLRWPVLRSENSPAYNPASARKVVRLTQMVCRLYKPWSNCLNSSLLLWWLLRGQQIQSDLQIGVRRSVTGQFEAHAWVECGGNILNDRSDVREKFAVFDRPVIGKIF